MPAASTSRRRSAWQRRAGGGWGGWVGGGVEAAVAEARDAGLQALDWVAGDIREPAEARRLIETLLERHGRLDVLVNNAGGQYFTPAELIAEKGWRAVWRLNVEGMLNMAEEAYEPGFGPAGGGRRPRCGGAG